MTDPHIGATITVTLKDGSTVSTSTWEACVGVGQFVATFLGEPAAHHTINTKETPCSTGCVQSAS